VCGNGRAAKDQVARMVARLLGLAAAPLPDHTTMRWRWPSVT